MASDAPTPETTTAFEPQRIDFDLYRRHRIEVLVVLLLFVLPSFYFSIYHCLIGYPSRIFHERVATTLIWCIEVSAPVLYIMWRSGEGWGHFGIARFRWFSDPLTGLALYGIFSFIMYGVFGMTQPLLAAAMRLTSGLPRYSFPIPVGIGQHVMLVAMSLFNGFNEELVMRGFLIPRMESLFRSTWLALFFTTLLFASYHCYLGVYGLANAVILGLFFGSVFCWFRRLWPVALAHALMDYLGWVSLAHGG